MLLPRVELARPGAAIFFFILLVTITLSLAFGCFLRARLGRCPSFDILPTMRAADRQFTNQRGHLARTKNITIQRTSQRHTSYCGSRAEADHSALGHAFHPTFKIFPVLRARAVRLAPFRDTTVAKHMSLAAAESNEIQESEK